MESHCFSHRCFPYEESIKCFSPEAGPLGCPRGWLLKVPDLLEVNVKGKWRLQRRRINNPTCIIIPQPSLGKTKWEESGGGESSNQETHMMDEGLLLLGDNYNSF